MGRRGVRPDQDERWVFNRLAGAYRARPGYPVALVDRLARLVHESSPPRAGTIYGHARPVHPSPRPVAGSMNGHALRAKGGRYVWLRPSGSACAKSGHLVFRPSGSALAGPDGKRVADLGAGTGHLAIPLAEAGFAVAAVEPARAMREALVVEAEARGLSIEPVAAAAEATGLPGGAFALVVIADALHWIDPDVAGREVARLLAPGGVVAVVSARPAPTPFMMALTALVEAANPKARRRAVPRSPGQLLAAAAPGVAVAEERFRQEAALDSAALEAVLRSLSYVGPALGPEALAAVIEDARKLATRFGGAVWARELRLSWAARRLGVG